MLQQAPRRVRAANARSAYPPIAVASEFHYGGRVNQQLGSPSYRTATLDDLDTVVRLLAELVDELGPKDVAKQVKPKLRGDLDNALRSPNVRVFLVEIDGHVAGLARADVLTQDPIFRLRDDHRCGYIDQMYVRPTYRGRRLGAALLSQCETWFRSQGIGHTLLHAAPNAVRFYARQGYLPNREMFKRL